MNQLWMGWTVLSPGFQAALNLRNPSCDPLWMYYFGHENPRTALKSCGDSDGCSVGIFQPSVMQSKRAAFHADEASGGPCEELVS